MVFGYIYRSTDRKERIEMLTAFAFATPMELFFSEVWKIYEYQRGLMPLFVPAGHYFLFDLGRIIADKFDQSFAMPILLPFVPMVAFGIYHGSDTSAIFLLILVLAFTKFGPQPCSVCSNGMGSIGDGNCWDSTWQLLDLGPMKSRGPDWTAWNPPLLVGAFYCLGDLLVNMTVVRFEEKATVG